MLSKSFKVYEAQRFFSFFKLLGFEPEVLLLEYFKRLAKSDEEFSDRFNVTKYLNSRRF